MSDKTLPTVVGEGEFEFFGVKVRTLVLSDGSRIVPKEDFDAFLKLLGVPAVPRCICYHAPEQHNEDGCFQQPCECGWDGKATE